MLRQRLALPPQVSRSASLFGSSRMSWYRGGTEAAARNQSARMKGMREDVFEGASAYAREYPMVKPLVQFAEVEKRLRNLYNDIKAGRR